jgi:1-acyl-sn-glycerol-3-phosphate acyltransferase
MLYRLFKNLFKIFFKLFYRFEVIGLDNIPTSGPVMLVSNHVSNWDPPVLGSASNRQVFFLAKEELFKIPVLNFLLPAWGVLPLKRGRGDREAITKSIEVLSDGKILGIFIEGTRNKGNPDHLGKPQPGAAMFALKSNATVIPTLLLNTRTVGKSFQKVKVIFGKPLQLINDPTLEKKELYTAVSHQIAAAIDSLRPIKKT